MAAVEAIPLATAKVFVATFMVAVPAAVFSSAVVFNSTSIYLDGGSHLSTGNDRRLDPGFAFALTLAIILDTEPRE